MELDVSEWLLNGLGTMLSYLGGVNVEVVGLGKGDSREESGTDEKLGLHGCDWSVEDEEGGELWRCLEKAAKECMKEEKMAKEDIQEQMESTNYLVGFVVCRMAFVEGL